MCHKARYLLLFCAVLALTGACTGNRTNGGGSAADHYIADAISEGSGGQTFLQFVNGYRLARATQLLTETDEPIEQIAFDSGFNNRRTFNRVFRDEYGYIGISGPLPSCTRWKN